MALSMGGGLNRRQARVAIALDLDEVNLSVEESNLMQYLEPPLVLATLRVDSLSRLVR